MRLIAALLVAGALSGASVPDPQRSPEAQAKLDKMLEGRVADRPVTCLPVVHVLHPIAVDDQTLVFRDGPRIWVNNLRGSFQCGQLDKMSDVQFGSMAEPGLCRRHHVFHEWNASGRMRSWRVHALQEAMTYLR